MSALEKWAVNLAIMFVLRQVAKFQMSVDWGKVKSDLEPRIRALVPGEWVDDEVVAVVNYVVDHAALALKDQSDMQALLSAMAAQDWEHAFAALKSLILQAGLWPTNDKASPLEKRALRALVAA